MTMQGVDTTYTTRRGEIETYFDRTAARAWEQLTSNAPLGRIRATVRQGRDQMRSTLLSWLPEDLRGARILDAGALGLAVSVFINVRLERQVELALETFEKAIAERPEVMECYLMTGDSDYLIRVAVADIAALEKFILEQLTPIPGIEKIRSSFALKQVRYKTALPLMP